MLNKVIKVLLIIILVVVLIEVCLMVYADYLAVDATKEYLRHINDALNK